MGKRKSSKPPPKKQRPKLEKFFSCPFCNSDKTVSATFDWERQIGTVNCTVCQVCCSAKCPGSRSGDLAGPKF